MQLLALDRREQRVDLFGFLGWKRRNDVGGVIGRHLLQQRNDFRVRQQFEQGLSGVIVDHGEDIGRPLVAQLLEHDHLLLVLQVLEQLGDIRRMERIEERT